MKDLENIGVKLQPTQYLCAVQNVNVNVIINEPMIDTQSRQNWSYLQADTRNRYLVHQSSTDYATRLNMRWWLWTGSLIRRIQIRRRKELLTENYRRNGYHRREIKPNFDYITILQRILSWTPVSKQLHCKNL